MQMLYSPTNLFNQKNDDDLKDTQLECLNILLKAQKQARKDESDIIILSRFKINTKIKKRCVRQLMEDSGWIMHKDRKNYYFVPRNNVIKPKVYREFTSEISFTKINPFNNDQYFGNFNMGNDNQQFGNEVNF
jgi:hypothetical protein